MRPLCQIVLMLALIAIVAVESSNITWTSEIIALKRSLNDDNDTMERSYHVLEERELRSEANFLHGSTVGGRGGGNFDDLHDIGTSGTYTPTSISLRCAKYVDSIQTTYQTRDERPIVAQKRGGNGGSPMQFDLQPNERIVKVIINSGTYINQLQFFTNTGRVSNVCGRHSTGQVHTEQHPNYVLSYISGRSGSLVDSIQLHWVREDVKYFMTSVEYHLNNIKQMDTESLKGTYVAELINHGFNEQSKSYTKTITVSETDTWSMHTEMTTGVSVSIEAGIPKIGALQVSVSTSYTFGFTYGKTKTVETSNAYTLSTVVPGQSKVKAAFMIFESVIEVPFTADLTIVCGDGTKVIKRGERGIFRGVQAGRTVAEYGRPIHI